MNSNLKKFKKFIICDLDTGRPMTFDKDQLCFCTREDWEDEHLPVKLYSYKRAKYLIKKTKDYRSSQGFNPHNYILFPVR